MDAFISVPENVSNIEMEKARKLFEDFAEQIMVALVRIFGISRLRVHKGQKIFLVMLLKKNCLIKRRGTVQLSCHLFIMVVFAVYNKIYIVSVSIVKTVFDMTTISITDETHIELRKIKGELMASNGKERSFDDIIMELVRHWKVRGLIHEC